MTVFQPETADRCRRKLYREGVRACEEDAPFLGRSHRRAGAAARHWLTSSSNYSGGDSRQWGNESLGDKPLLGDFDGDGKSDLGLWRASTGTWYWLTSSSNYQYGDSRQWGNESLGDVPAVGDFDGDGKADLCLWRASKGKWYWLTSSSRYAYVTVRVSYDDGQTWPASRVVHEGHAAYSSMVALPDGRIGLLFERGEKSAYERLTLATFPLDWLESGRDAGDRR